MATFGSKALIDPRMLAVQCALAGLPTDWVGKPNRYENPLGTDSGTGFVLMLRADLDADDFDINGTHDLVFEDGGANDPVTLRNLHIVGTRCLTPGAPNDKNAVHLVELADVRRRLKLATANVGYNLRTTPTGNYQPNTTQDGIDTAWTWTQVLADLWALLDSDALDSQSAPAFPPDTSSTSQNPPALTPQGTPEQLAYHAVPVMDALGDLFNRLAFALALDLTAKTNPFSLVRPGDAQLASLEKKHLRRRLHDIEPVSPSFGTVPATVDVYFRKEPTRAYGNSPFYVVSVDAPARTDGTSADGEAGTLMVFDDLRATYQGGTLTNLADLEDRADARATEFFRERRAFYSQPKLKVYSGALSDFKPGSETQAVTWEDRGAGPGPFDGVTTTVSRLPPRDPTASWPGTPEQPWRLVEVVYVKDSSGAGSGTAGGYLDAQVERWNPVLDAWEVLFDCWAKKTTADGVDVPVGRYPACTFSGFQDDRPVYALGCCPDGTGEGTDDGSPGGTVVGDTPNDAWDDTTGPDHGPDGTGTGPTARFCQPDCSVRVQPAILFATIPGVGTAAMVWDVAHQAYIGGIRIPGCFGIDPGGQPYQGAFCFKWGYDTLLDGTKKLWCGPEYTCSSADQVVAPPISQCPEVWDLPLGNTGCGDAGVFSSCHPIRITGATLDFSCWNGNANCLQICGAPAVYRGVTFSE